MTSWAEMDPTDGYFVELQIGHSCAELSYGRKIAGETSWVKPLKRVENPTIVDVGRLRRLADFFSAMAEFFNAGGALEELQELPPLELPSGVSVIPPGWDYLGGGLTNDELKPVYEFVSSDGLDQGCRWVRDGFIDQPISLKDLYDVDFDEA